MNDPGPPVLWTWRLLKTRILRVARPALAICALWLAWALAALALRDREDGLFVALLLLGLCVVISAAMAGLVWYLTTRRLRARDATELTHLIWLNQVMQPRRPLPPLGTWTANPDLLVALWRLIRDKRPARVLELGSGLSTLVMAHALEQNQEGGEIVSLESHPHFSALTRRQLAEHGLEGHVRVMDAPLQKQSVAGRQGLWYALSPLEGLADVELLFVDGPGNRERVMALFLLHGSLAAKADIVIDDVDRPESRRMLNLWLDAFPGQLYRSGDGAAKWAVFHWRRDAGPGAAAATDAPSTRS
ncbi:MAG: class I SAM-dependent methyltransferase [Anaerolineaceae bacterium]|nr:class I SAM-dependent methyltransferase [Anaerolineaceae bacterium]MCY4023795.1 class I SAM-dependent methyltransferase [Anaerolineaceae bacterium]